MITKGYVKENQKQTNNNNITKNQDIIIECSLCGEKLVSVVTMLTGNEDINTITWNVKAKCCFCGDYSFNTKIKGQFAVNGIDGSTKIANINHDDDSIVLFEVNKC